MDTFLIDRKNKKGFTLIELVAAIVVIIILLVVIVGIVAGFIYIKSHSWF